jgi:4-amino-4-deoxy-L-arabinose transferase-like glycosyltransferase
MQNPASNILNIFLQKIFTFYYRVLHKKNLPFFISFFYLVVMLPVGLIFHQTGSYHVVSENDLFSSYIPHAKELLNGNFIIDPYRGPVYVFMLAAAGYLLGDFLQAGIFIASISAAFVLYFVFKIIEQLFGRNTALAVTSITICNAIFIQHTYGAGTDMLFAALVSGSVYFLLAKKDYHFKNVFLSAILAGVAYLTRYNASYLMLLIPAVIVFINFYNLKIKRSLISAVVFAAVGFIIIVPWGIYNLNERGDFFFNENYRNIAITLEESENFDWEKAWFNKKDEFNSFYEIIAEAPLPLFKTFIANLSSHLFYDLKYLMGLQIGIFVLMGIYYFGRSGFSSRVLAYFFINIFFFLIIVPVFYSTRFSLFLIPFYALLGYYGLKLFVNLYFNKNRAKNIFAASIFILVFTNFLNAAHTNHYRIKGPDEIIKAGKLVHDKSILTKNKKIAARLPHIAYHLNMKWEKIPYNLPLQETIKALKEKNTDYLFVGKMEYKTREYLKHLIEPAKAPRELKPLVYMPNEQAVIYKILR